MVSPSIRAQLCWPIMMHSSLRRTFNLLRPWVIRKSSKTKLLPGNLVLDSARCDFQFTRLYLSPMRFLLTEGDRCSTGLIAPQSCPDQRCYSLTLITHGRGVLTLLEVRNMISPILRQMRQWRTSSTAFHSSTRSGNGIFMEPLFEYLSEMRPKLRDARYPRRKPLLMILNIH